MFRHCVMMRWTDDSTAEQRETARAAVAGLPSLIPEIRSYSVGFDAGLADTNFDMVVVGDFDDVEGYKVYVNHPDHLQVIQEFLKPIAAERAAVQYEL